MRLVIPVALLAIGCLGTGESPKLDGDAGIDAGGSHPTPPAPPARPDPPELAPCPDGWRETPDPDDEGLAFCHPWPADGPGTCGAGEASFPGGAACERIGTACPLGEFPEDLPAGAAVRYVRAGEPPGGDGSLAAPFGTIADALAGASDGTILALSKGTFDEAVELFAPVTLRGACVAETNVTCTTQADRAATIHVREGGARIENLSVSGARFGIESWTSGEPVVIDAVSVEGTEGVGLLVEGGTVEATDFLIRDVVPRRSDGAFGHAIELNGGVTYFTRASVERGTSAGLVVYAVGTRLEATDFAVRDTITPDVSDQGEGLYLADGATASLSRVAFVRNRGLSLIAIGAGTALDLADAYVADTYSQALDDPYGFALSVSDGARVTAARARFESGVVGAVDVVGAGSTFDAVDLVVRATRFPDGGRSVGAAVQVAGGATATLERARIERNAVPGVYVQDEGTSLLAIDLDVRDADRGDGIAGLQASLGAEVVLREAAIDRTSGVGVYADGAGTWLEASDLSIGDTRGVAGGYFGTGLQTGAGAAVEVVRTEIRGGQTGVLAFDSGTTLGLEDARIGETLENACSDPACSPGIGLSSIEGASITATRFAFSSNALCGIQLADGGTMDLSDGEVSRSPIGANVQTEGFDLTRIQDGVYFIEDDTAIDSSSLPVPEAISPEAL